ncbi:zinc ribbon domain-containing protein [Acinetobacter sp. WCHAc060033]|uniref:zinc ribbon domain-containing protein n=1 Tax=Acinetobacter sp. WCHAc060033 TaxID=2518624 RepID=UPI001022A6A9|nr:zinc ribbon domain-containing protein [Acinetobacter sp. WCHAc060033]RZG79143.1 zinc ribbon domain-containing protein [Acinetobacter sp. WCHAc060033]
MKCQKCHAENISEAVKCGICGTRLKHPKSSDDFTGSQHVQSSIRRENNKQDIFNPDPSIKPNTKPSQNRHSSQNQSITDTILDKNTKIEDKARILLDSWQDKAKDAWENAQNQPKKKPKYNKWFFIIIAVFIFASPVITLITSVIIPEIQYQIREHLRIQRENDEAAVEDVIMEDIVTTDAVVDANEYEQRYAEMRSYQQNIERMFGATRALPENLQEIEKFDQVEFDQSIHDVIEIRNGMIIGSFAEFPNEHIYLKPEIKNKKIIGWSCYKVGISEGEMSECEPESSEPTAPIVR